MKIATPNLVSYTISEAAQSCNSERPLANHAFKERTVVTPNIPEEWRTIKGFPRYEVSNLGRVRTFAGKRPPGTHLTQTKNKAGYLFIGMVSDCGKQTTRSVHRVVAMSFLDADPNRPHVNHINGIKADNRAANLEWVTQKENQEHASRIGLKAVGEKHGRAVFTDALVLEARAKFREGQSMKSLAARYGVWHSTMRSAVVGKSWKHLNTTPTAKGGRK